MVHKQGEGHRKIATVKLDGRERFHMSHQLLEAVLVQNLEVVGASPTVRDNDDRCLAVHVDGTAGLIAIVTPHDPGLLDGYTHGVFSLVASRTFPK